MKSAICNGIHDGFSKVSWVFFGGRNADAVTNIVSHELGHHLTPSLDFLQEAAAVFVDITLFRENNRTHIDIAEEYKNQYYELQALRKIVGDENVGNLLCGDMDTFKKAFDEAQNVISFDDYHEYSKKFFGANYDSKMARFLENIAEQPTAGTNSPLGVGISEFFKRTIGTIDTPRTPTGNDDVLR